MTMRRRFMTSRNTYNLEDYVHFTMLENGSVTFRDFNYFIGLQYSINNGPWENNLNFNVKKGDVVAIKAYGYSKNKSEQGLFGLPSCNLGGNIMSLYYGDDAKNHTQELMPRQFAYLFYKTSIVSVAADFLPATTLADSCYYGMFRDCPRLTTAPELPATTLTKSCYYNMFYGCRKLNYIKMLATNISASNCLYNWVNGVASTGTFVKNPSMTSLPTGPSGIPSGWTVVNDGEDSGGGNDKDIQGDFPEESKSLVSLYI